MDDLSDRQQLILNYILSEIQKKGYPPSVREIGEAVGLSSSSSVHAHLARLEEMGYLRRDPTKPRAIEVLIGNTTSSDIFQPNNVKYVPIIGSVTAGQPIFAEQNVQDYFPLPSNFSSAEEVYMLKVKGDSMINAGIYDGDFVIVNRSSAAANGEIVVALVDDEATVKRFYKEQSQIRLQPENDRYEPILSTNVNIAGKVIGLIRKI